MKSLIVRAVVLCSIPASSIAQSQLEWLSTHDGAQSQDDFGRACAVDGSGNVYVAGRSYNPSVGIPPPPPQADFELVKFSPTGVELWSARKDAFGSEDFALDCQVSPAGDVYVSGYGWNGNDIDLVLLKYSSAGVFQWMRTHASPGGSDFGRAIAFDANGNVLVCGNAYGATTNSDVLIKSYTPAGALNWSTVFDGGASGIDSAYALTVLTTGEIGLAGQLTSPTGGADFAMWKLTAAGALVWTRAFDGGSNLTDGALAIAQRSSTQFVAGGWRTTSANGEDWMFGQIDFVSGNLDWIVFYDGSAHGNERVRSLAVDAQGVAWVCGTASNTSAGIDFVTRRYHASNFLMSSATWNNTSTNLDDSPFKVLLGSAGQAWVCGYTTLGSGNYDAVVVQYDATGAFNWANTYSSAGAFDDRPFDMELTPSSRIAMGGYTNSGPSGGYDYLALQVDPFASPEAYCTAKTTSTGCVPSVGFTGMSSASASSGFVVSCAQVRNQKNGLLFYGVNGSASLPFQGGTMCVAVPQVRTPIQVSGGNASPADDCSGVFALDMNAYATGSLGGAPLPALQVVGTTVHCQFWGRDPGFATPQNTMLSNALRYVVLP